MTKKHVLIALAAATLGSTAAALAQQGGQGNTNPNQAPTARPKKPTQDQVREHEVAQMVNILGATYKLTPEQRLAVRGEVRKINQEYYREMGPTIKEMDRVEKQLGTMYQAWLKKQQATGKPQPKPWEDAKYIKLQKRLEVLKQKNQVDWKKTMERVEKLLPPSQVKTAHAHRQEWIQRLQQSKANQATAEATGISSWEQYTLRIIAQYQFDPGQQNAARAILKDVQDRAQPIRRAREAVLQSLQTGTLTDGQIQQLGALNDQIEGLFQELKNRLEDMVTEQQRKTGSKPAP